MRGLDGNNAVDGVDDNARAEVRVRRGTRNVFVLKPCYKTQEGGGYIRVR